VVEGIPAAGVLPEGRPVDLATISPCIAHAIRRFGDWIPNLMDPQPHPAGHRAPTHLDLESRFLFVP
jgi:hypothetical protein